MSRLLCTDPDCIAPGVRRVNEQWFCLFHPEQRRPNIDPYTGKVRETKEEAKAREREEKRIARELAKTEKPAVKVIRPPKPRPSKAVPLDPDDVTRRYELGQSIHQIARALHTSQGRISALLHERQMVVSRTRRREQAVDHASVAARYLAGERARDIATDLGVRQSHITESLRQQGIQILYGKATHNVNDAELIRRYVAGEGLFSIAQSMRIGTKRAREILVEAGVPIRARGDVGSGRRGPVPRAVDEDALVADYLAGENSTALRAKYAISGRRVLRILHERGVVRAPAAAARKTA